jgi:predicted nucleotidyltransferase
LETTFLSEVVRRYYEENAERGWNRLVRVNTSITNVITVRRSALKRENLLVVHHLKYPHEGYKKVLVGLVEYFKKYPGVYAIVLTGSLARGKAVKGSCIDLCIFLSKRQFDALPSTIASRTKAYARLKGQICYYEGEVEGGIMFEDVRVDISFSDGKFNPSYDNSFDITRDEFETTIGNLFAYSMLLYERDTRYQQLKRKYLPFYDDDLRKARLDGTAKEFKYKIWKTRWLAKRGEYLAALETLLEAQQIFLQHLFIKKRKYPIDYLKWIKEQCFQILAILTLYEELTSVINGIKLTENGIVEKSNLLEKLFARYESLDETS